MPSQHTITITVTEEQARTIATACEILARLGIGQYRGVLDKQPPNRKGCVMLVPQFILGLAA